MTLASAAAFHGLLLVTGVFSPPGDVVGAAAGVAVGVIGLGIVDVVIFV